MSSLQFKDQLECGYMNDIIDCIQERVDKIVYECYKSDDCYPVFKVSVLYKKDNKQELILNCTHLERTFSRVLFPDTECFYDYESLGRMIEGLYNQTM